MSLIQKMSQIQEMSQIQKMSEIKKCPKLKNVRNNFFFQIKEMSQIKQMSQEFKIVQNTGNVSYILSAIYSTHARPERRRREGHCKTNANA